MRARMKRWADLRPEERERALERMRARGFTPNPIRLAEASPQILAVGGELKNTFCLVRDGQAFVSQHIGDLKDARTHASFTGEIEAWKKLLRIEPEVFAHDLHPVMPGIVKSTHERRHECGPGQGRGDAAGIGVETEDAEPGPGELHRERQAHVAEAHDRHPAGTGLETVAEGRRRRHARRRRRDDRPFGRT